jgi:hypothetical protein
MAQPLEIFAASFSGCTGRFNLANPSEVGYRLDVTIRTSEEEYHLGAVLPEDPLVQTPVEALDVLDDYYRDIWYSSKKESTRRAVANLRPHWREILRVWIKRQISDAEHRVRQWQHDLENLDNPN